MTLLEVIISIALFSVIAVSLMRMTNATIQYQKRMTAKITDIHYQRNSFQILQRDLRNIFFIEDINAKIQTLYVQREQQRNANTFGGVRVSIDPFIRNNPYLHTVNPKYGGLKGTKNSLHIGSFSNTRTQPDEKASDQNIISYYLKPCKSRWNPTTEIKSCLWRKATRYPEKTLEDPENFEEFVLLENIKEFQISYFNIFTNQWVTSWSTEPNEQNALPSYIKINIKYQNDKKQSIQQELNIPIYQQQIPLKVIAG